jgi:dynein heavy chain
VGFVRTPHCSRGRWCFLQLHAELAAYHDTLRPQDAEVTEEPEEESGIADTAVSSSKPVPSFDRFTPTPDTSPDKKTRRSVKDLRGEYVPHEEEDVPVETVVCQMFLFALTWTVGANLNRESRKVFDTWLLRFCAGDSQHSRDLSSALPPGSVWDYSLDVRSHRWMQWEQCIAPTMYDCDRLESMPLVYPDHRIHAADLWIPSTEALASATIVQVLVSTKFPVILHGPSGSGKTAIMHHALKRLREDEGYLPLEFRLRRKSTAEGLKGGVSENLEHRRKNLLGPPNGQRMALFVDDLNLHARSSSIPELLRSFLEQRGWHPLQKTTFHRVEDVHLLACSDRLDTRIGGAGHRLQRHFLAMKNDELDALTLASITQTLLAMRFSAPNQLQFWYELDAVSSMALEVWSTAAKHFLVTPASPHYTFDVSTYFSIIQAVLFADAAHVLDVRGRLPRLLVHESLRCIGDRLSSEEDRQWLQRSLVTVAERHFNSFRMDVAQLSELHFGDCELEAGYADTDMRLFAQRTYASAREVAQKQGLRFPVGFVLFQEASSQLLRILRVLREPQGHLLLGERGVGKRTVAALALHMSGMAVFECQAPTSKMDSAEVASCLAATRSRVWEATNVAALDDKHVVVYLTMDDLSLPSSQALLDDVQQLLSLGEIPEQVTAELRHEARSRVLEIFKVKMQKRAEVDPNTRPASKSKGGTSSQADSHQPTLSEQLDMVKMRVSTSASFRSSDPMYNRYVTSLRSKLHVVCVVDVDDDKRALRQSLCANPSLLKCCAVDWFGPWSEAAFKSVAQAHFDLDPELLADAQLSVVDMERVVSCLAHVHCTTLGMARQLTCAPASTPEIQLGLPDSSVNNTAKAAVWASRTSVLAYTELVLGFKQNLRSRRAHLSSKIELLETSIDASQSLMAEMETMEEQVADVGEVLAEAKTELDTVNQSIEEEAARVRSEEASILAKADEIAAEAKEAMALADAARAALDAAMPELERAQTLLGSITKQDIAELKGFRVPPESMMLTVEALCIVLGIAPKRVEASKASKKVSKGPRTPRSTGASTDNSPRSLLSTPRSMSNSGSATGLAQLASESEAVESAEAASGTTVETAEDGAVTPSADKKSPSKKVRIRIHLVDDLTCS